MSEPKMPERQPTDGKVQVHRSTEGDVIVASVETDGQMQTIMMSEYNAWRLFGLLAFMLGIQLPAKLAKAIKL